MISSEKRSQVVWVLVSTCLGVGSISIVQNILPLLIGAVIVGLGLTASEAGIAFTFDGFAMGLTAFVFAPIIGKLPQRRTIWTALVTIALTHILMAFVETSMQVIVLRTFSGVAAGVAVVAFNNIIATSSDPIRFYGATNATAILLAILLFLILPPAIESYGVQGAFWPAAAIIILIMPTMLGLPKKKPAEAAIQETSAPSSKKALHFVYLGMIFLVQAAQVAYYAFVERRAVSIGIDPQTIGNILSLAYMLAFGAMLLTTWVGNRFGRVLPLVIALSGNAVTIYISLTSNNPDVAMVAIVAQSPFFLAAIPYMLGLGALMDKSGKLANFGIAILFLSAGCGPMIGGLLIDQFGFSAIASLNIFITVISLLVFHRANKSIVE